VLSDWESLTLRTNPGKCGICVNVQAGRFPSKTDFFQKQKTGGFDNDGQRGCGGGGLACVIVRPAAPVIGVFGMRRMFFPLVAFDFSANIGRVWLKESGAEKDV